MTVGQRRLVSPELLLALAAGQDWPSGAWKALLKLMRPPGETARGWFSTSREAFEEFKASPNSGSAAILSQVLEDRALSESSFRDGLSEWVEAYGNLPAQPVNMISGGTFHGNVVQGRDFQTVHIFTSDPTSRG